MQVTIIVIGLLLVVEASIKSELVCGNKHKYGPFKFKLTETTNPTAGVSKTNSVVTTYPKKIEVIVAYRRRYTNYCYTNFLWHSECDESLKDDMPSRKEAVQWSKENKCYVSKSCSIISDCWGSGAATCKESKPSYDTVGRGNFLYSGRPSPKKLYHTCTQDWMCGVKRSEMRVHTKQLEGGQIELHTADENGEIIVLNSTFWEYGYYKEGRYTIYPIGELPIPKFVKTTAQCFGTSKNKIVCYHQTEEKGGLYHSTEVMLSTFKGTMNNYVLEVSGPLSVVVNGTLIIIDKPIGNSTFSTNSTDNSFKTASLENIYQLIVESKANQLQMLHNIMSVDSKLVRLEEITLEIVKTLSFNDNTLLARLLGYEGISQWFNKNLFYLIKCQTEIEMETSNCAGPIIFSNNGMKIKKKGDQCLTISQDKIKSLSIFKESDLYVEELYNFDPEVSSNEWDLWTSYRESVNNRVNFETTIDSDVNKDWMQFGSGFPFNLGSWYSYFSFASNIMIWVFGILLIVLLKRC